MIPRMTTVGTLKNYRYNLNQSTYTMTKAMDMVVNQRLFNSYADDPALATRCFQIRNSYKRTENQYELNESLRHKYDVAWEATGTCSTDLYALSTDASLSSVIKALNQPTGGGRVALGQSLEAKAKDLAQTMNARYGENYVYGGADTLNPPFTWQPKKNPAYIDPETLDETNPVPAEAFQYVTDNGDLTNDPAKAAEELEINPLYNANVGLDDPHYHAQYFDKDTGEPTDDVTKARMKKKENTQYDPMTSYKYLTSGGGGTNVETEAQSVLHYRNVPTDSNEPADVEKMEYFLHGESKYIDVGLGHKEKEGDAVSSTVFDSALQGIYYLGGYDCYGTKKVFAEIKDESGAVRNSGTVEVPNNIISVVSEMGQILQRCDPDGGEWASDEDQLRFQALVNEFESGTNAFRERWTEMDTQTGFLRDNSELLGDAKYNLSQQYAELEYADPAGAISNYMFARYAYDTALKVGNSVLSQSLMDYLNL